MTADKEALRSSISKRTTADTSVREILETFAPPREDSTNCHLVTFGPQHHFLVIQGPEAEKLTGLILTYVDALYETQPDAH